MTAVHRPAAGLGRRAIGEFTRTTFEHFKPGWAESVVPFLEGARP